MNSAQLVFLHGWGMHCSVWDFSRADFSDYSAVAPALPGYGAAPYRPGGGVELAQDLAARFDAPLIVCGWSLGAQIAMRWALAAPDQIHKLILVGASPSFVARSGWRCGVAPQVFRQFALDLGTDYVKTIVRFFTLQAGEADRATLRELRRTLSHVEPSLAVLRQGLHILLNEDLRDDVKKIGMPTLIINGARDKLVPACAAEYLVAAIPDAELELVPDAGHAPFLSYPERFAKRLREFIDG